MRKSKYLPVKMILDYGKKTAEDIIRRQITSEGGYDIRTRTLSPCEVNEHGAMTEFLYRVKNNDEG